LLFSDSADDQINAAFRACLKLLTPSQIRRGRKQLGLSQGELAEKIGAAEGTISRWETGALVQSRTSDNLLRVYFALAEVRAVLVGEGQDPKLGVEDESLNRRAPAESQPGRYSQFTFASAAYGEEGLSTQIAYFQKIGSLLPVGKG
jgi:transcriptional regulator with XRE-family HTH domain